MWHFIRQSRRLQIAALVLVAAGLVVSLAAVVPAAKPAATVIATFEATAHTPAATDTPNPTVTATPRPDTPTPTYTSTRIPAPTPTRTEVPPPPYTIEPITPDQGLGIRSLMLVTSDVETQVIDPYALRLPSPTLLPDTGRFGVTHYTLDLIHLGSDFLNPLNDLLLSPHPEAILVGLAHLQRSTYTAIALDLSGDLQMYYVRLAVEEGPHSYVIAYTHFQDGGNAAALAQALDNDGHVETMGRISLVGPDNPNLSDMHIAAIDVDKLLDFTGAGSFHEGLAMLFGDDLPRVNQQYPSIFIRPEDVFPALAALLEEYGR